MARLVPSLMAGVLLWAPVAAGAQQNSLDRDPADTRIQGTVQPLNRSASPGNQPIGRVVPRMGGDNDQWTSTEGGTARPQGPDRTLSGLGSSGLAPNQGTMSTTPNSAPGTMGGGAGYGGAVGPAR